MKTNEPVAWMYAVNGIWTAFSDELPPDDAYDEGTLTPLYTHPHSEESVKAKTPTLVLDGNRVYATEKTLTDEEIKQVWKLNLVAMGNDLDFARAILRKASEK